MKKWILLVGLLALTAPMFGAIVIDFGDGGITSGTVTNVVGGGASTNAPGIAVEIMKVDVGLGFTSYHTTGLCGPDPDGSACLNFSFNAAGVGTLTVVGGVVGLPGGVTLASTLLLDGVNDTFTKTLSGTQLTINAFGPDTKSQALLNALGLGSLGGTNQWAINNGFSIASLQVGSTNTYNAFSTDIPNSPVPEPASILLLGTVLFGVTHSIRRRMVSKA